MSLANSKAVANALERLVNTGSLYRVASRIYLLPVIDRILGTVMPRIEDIAEAIFKRDKARAVRNGSYALYKLGLTTQVPMNVVLYTDSSLRKVKIGQQSIIFKRPAQEMFLPLGTSVNWPYRPYAQ